MEQATIRVVGMSCSHCVSSVEGALKANQVQGTVDLATGTVSIQYDPDKINLDTIKNVIEEQGYTVR
ncbi:cation transporter [Paenibacillus sp. 7541]|uniref:cation transporter n=1 Tax=Paenibacillus sp. 7541 TaxID=2026236 RepID=UPI000BA5FC17|nr:cation transporter [Paenibacillus sp. 7541]PAK50304.1 copper resistance protein CopZ [Paenibacillus sp. 7541]